MASELGTMIALIVDRYLDIQRDGGTVLDAVAEVLYDMGYIVLTTKYHKELEVAAKAGRKQ